MITRGLQESRNARLVADPADAEAQGGQSLKQAAEDPFPPYPPPLLSSTPIPPEAPSEERWTRFMTEADEGLFWDPDSPTPGARREQDSFKLETRGITQQNENSHPPVASSDCAEPPSAQQSGLSPTCVRLDADPHIDPEPVEKRSQAELWRKQTVHKNSIAAKLREAGMVAEAQKLELCHSYYTVAICNQCGSTRKFPNRCDQGHCPECQPGLARERAKQVTWWTATIKQPKHVVLTLRNIPALTAPHLAEARRYLTALRRSAFATKRTWWWEDRATGAITRTRSRREQDPTGQPLQSQRWRGGFYSIELTKQRAGWHLHFHALVDADYIDQRVLSDRWKRITRGFSYIVKVTDCRREDYLTEVTKYAVKGSQLAKWEPAEVAQFVSVFSGARTFGVFGSLYGQRTEFAEFIADLKGSRPLCDCGSCSIRYLHEADWLIAQALGGRTPIARPRPPPAPPPELFPDPFVAYA